jgi:hypothetical protein
MHQPEYTFEQAVGLYANFPEAPCPGRFLELIESQSFAVGGAARQFTRTQVGWNSGVLGLPAAAAALLPDLYTLTDTFYAGSGWFTAEQLAFSLALPCQFPLQRSDQYVVHYWGAGQKKLMDARLGELLTPAFGQQALPRRLAAVRPLTTACHRHLELDKLREGALYALSRGRWVPGAKYTLKALTRAPLDLRFPQQVMLALRQAHRPAA